MKDKIISCVLSASIICASIGALPVRAEDTPYFTHQNVVGNQTCYGDDTAETTITEIPNVKQGIRINRPFFRAYLGSGAANQSYTVKQLLKDGTVLKSETVTANAGGKLEFEHVRNCEAIEILSGTEVVASLGTQLTYINGVAITKAPMSYQVYQRDENDEATITIKGVATPGTEDVTVTIGSDSENVTIEDNAFTYTKTLGTGHYDITVKSGEEVVATYEKVGVGDVWVAAGQSNMTDMGAITDGFTPDTDDPINDNMHIIYAEDCTWHEMSHPAGEGRFFKTGTRTSPVTSFAREIAASENVPVGIVQSSVGGTNIWQWITGVRDSDANSGYLLGALKACFDKMPSANVKGILWYQGCNDAISENYAYDYKNLQQKMFDALHGFFGENTPIITTQINDANQDSTSSLGFYDAWSYVKDVQRQNENLYDNVYVVGTGELELGDTIHNSAASNVKLGAKWAKVAKAVAYGNDTILYRNAQIDTAKVTGDKEITLTFKDTDGLKLATGEKRIGITNVIGGGYKIALGDLKQEFVVRKGASRTATASNQGKGTEMTITNAQIVDGNKVVITTEENMAGVVAVDCMYGKRFTPTLVDASTNESVLSFYNVIAEYENAVEVTPAYEITATDTAYCFDGKEASDAVMYVNSYAGQNAQARIKFDLTGKDLSKIASAKLAVYGKDIDKTRGGNITVSDIGTDWDHTAVYGNPAYSPVAEIVKINGDNSSVFPVNNYSSIDVTDYLRKYTGNAIGIGIASDFASVTELYGVNSDNPPKLIIQPGKMVTLTYTSGGEPCADMEVTLEAVGATDYQTTKHTTDENGKLVLYLAEGSYRAVTEKEISKYEASANTFTVSEGDVTQTYTIEKNNEEKPKPAENPTYTFGDAYNVIKPENTDTLAETKIGDTGLSLSMTTTSTQYTSAGIIDKSTYNKLGLTVFKNSTLPANGYYLFMGAGGNNAVANATLKFENPIKAGKYVKITYAKPKTANKSGDANRTADNANTMTIGSETIDVKETCDIDTWYTSTIKVSADVSKIDFTFGSWSAVVISKIEVTDDADTMELTASDSEKYIIDGETVQYSAKVFNSITTLMNSTDIVARGAAAANTSVTYSVNGYEGVSIDANGLLTITSAAQEGNVTVSATCGNVSKETTLNLMSLGDADGVKIVGDELVNKGATLSLKALPTVSGTVVPERATDWSIEGDNHGASIANGVLTVPADATAGNITVKATLKAEGFQESANVSDTFTVTIKGEEASPYTIQGVFLKNCISNLSDAKGVDAIAIKATAATGCKAVVKAVGANGMVSAETEVSLDNVTAGVCEIKTPLTFDSAAQIKVYVINSAGEVVSEEIYKTDKTLYKNVPLVSDWITGKNSGLGMGAGIMSPTGAPYGVDPSVVDVSTLNVSYNYDNNYKGAETDNVLWYKTGAYAAGNSAGNNSIYARDGADWEQQALPIGNGYMGGMLFGLPDKDQIQINEETFWAAGYRGVQSSVAANNVNNQMSEGINGYMSVGNIFVDFNMPKGAQVKNYYRDLNLDESVAHVRYEYDGKQFNREYFASYPKEVLAFRYTGDNLNFDVKPVSMHPGTVTVNNGEIKIVGKLKDSEPYGSGGNAVWNQASDLEYCTIIKVIADDGTVTDGYNTVNVSGSTGVTILVAAATDYDKDQFELKADGSVDMTKTPYKSTRGVEAAIEKAEGRISGAAAMTYADLKAEHIADYKSQFDKVKFTLTDDDEVCSVPTNELQTSYKNVVNGSTKVTYNEAQYKALNKHLEELHYNYARYMMISSSRSNTMPATLQGKWCQSTAEIWGSCYCININMEMNYWFAGGANLLDSGKSLIGWFNSQIPAGRVTAKNMYKVTPKSYTCENGTITFTDSTDDKDDVFIMHTKQAIMGTTDLTGGTSIQSAGNTAWLMYNVWDLYQTTGDKELLENDLYPIMRKAANFYTQYLYTNEKKTTSDTTKYPDGYYYTTWAGRSPEQGPTEEGIKYDLQLVAGMYDYTIKAAETLGVDADKVAAWKEIRNHLELPVELGDDGQIKEWKAETTYNTDANGNAIGDPVHRHISHLVGLYPGTLINRDTPDLLEGAKIVLTNRGDDSTGWSCSNKFLLWARALDGDKALELFRFQLAQKTYANLFDTHAPFQIDGNFGSAAGVMELLMQSQTGDIYILPALPSVWDKGEISGIKAKNGAEVSIKWEDNKATEIKIVPAVDGDITIGYDKGNIISLDGKTVEFANGKHIIKNAVKGQIYTFSTEEGEEIDRDITLTETNVTATGDWNETLIVAGYKDGVLEKFEIINGLEGNLTGYDNCDTIKAFLWNSLGGMKPYVSKEITLTK